MVTKESYAAGSELRLKLGPIEAMSGLRRRKAGNIGSNPSEAVFKTRSHPLFSSRGR